MSRPSRAFVKPAAVIGGVLVVLSFARDLMSLAADVIEIASTVESAIPVSEALSSAPLRVLLLVVGITLIGMSLRRAQAATKEALAEHGFRTSIGSTLRSVITEGLDAIDTVSDDAIEGRVNPTLWWMTCTQFRRSAEWIDLAFAESRDVPSTVYVKKRK